MLLAYLGTGTVVALLYFQFANEWLVTAWAAVVFVLFGMALWLDRPIFLHQALLLTVGVCARGVMHNLFGASYFTGGDWTGRYFVLGSGHRRSAGMPALGVPVARSLQERSLPATGYGSVGAAS